MSKPSSIILLCEDRMQASLVYAYLNKCDYKTDRCVIRKVASEKGKSEGGNVGWVLEEFKKELHACRQRHRVVAETLLIVVIDADDFSVDDRRTHLKDKTLFDATDPLVLLIPRRHIETWIRAATNQPVGEIEDCKRPALGKPEFRTAATTIHGWARNAPPPGPTCVPSLRSAFPEWRKIG
ncbi:MAG: hypothetical protein WCH61_05515 [bacterium]